MRHPLLAIMLALVGCRGEPEAAAPAASSAPSTRPAASPEPQAAAPDPEREAKLADLDAMCKALNRDYGDGTLGDYYAGLEPRTAWGKQQLAAGNETIKPGRRLEQAVTELGLRPEQAPEHCRKLLDYLDEVE